MMTSEKAGGLLLNLMVDAAAEGNRAVVYKSVIKLKPQSEETTLACTLDEGVAALEQCGILLSEDTEPGETVGVILAGFGDKNPAIVELCPEGGALRVRATAKEGLIKQSTAKKAIAKLAAAL